MYNNRLTKFAVTSVGNMAIAAAGLLLLAPASAQVLEEIVVTATKRAESLQHVAISVDAIGGDAITAAGITNFEQLNVPGFKIPRAGMGDNIFMRGIGSGPNLGFEQSVPIYMNGLYFGRGRGSRSGFMDLARIEVVKGPQPTYFGKNAIAGAASLVWKQPTDEFEGYVDALYESENEEYIVAGALSGPISESVNGRIAVRYRDLSDGWLQNSTTGNSEPELNNLGFRGILTWDASDAVSIAATVFHSEDEENGRNQQTSICPIGGLFFNFTTDCVVDENREGFGTFFEFDGIDTGSGIIPLPVQTAGNLGADKHLNTSYNKLDLDGGSIEVQWDISDSISVTSLTGFYEYENLFLVNGDQTPVDIAGAGFTEIFEQFSQELRFQSSGDGGVSWLAGFYFDSNENQQVTTQTGMMSRYTDNSEDADSWAVFAEVEFEIGDSARLNLGGRYTEVDKDFAKESCQGSASPAAPTLLCGVGMGSIPFLSLIDQRNFDKFQPAIGVEWDYNDDTLVYASYKQGFKSGGWDFGPPIFPGQVADDLRFDQEEVDAIEIGVKMSLADGAATLNLAAFSSEFDDLQVTAFDPITNLVFVFNAATATSQGLEADLNWAASEYITVRGNFTWLDSTYDDFPNGTCFADAAPPDYPTCDLSTNPDGRIRSLAGEATPYAPDFAGRFSLDWRIPLSNDLEINSQFGVFTTSEYFTSGDNDPGDIQDSFTKWDLRIGIGPPDGTWEVALIGRNLSDELTCAFKGDIPFSNVGAPADPVTGAVQTGHFCMTERPRTVAVQGVFRF